jgi:hypothetical protein
MSIPKRRFSELKAMQIAGSPPPEFVTWWQALVANMALMLEEAHCNCDPNIVLDVGEQKTHAQARHFDGCPAMVGGKEWRAVPRMLDTKGGTA